MRDFRRSGMDDPEFLAAAARRPTNPQFDIVFTPALWGEGMKPFLYVLFFFTVLVTLDYVAQDAEEGLHAPDRGTFERFQSILLPPLPHAPFTATVTAEWTKVA